MELDKFDFDVIEYYNYIILILIFLIQADYEKELGLDSLEWTAVLTSCEYEFHSVFEDNLYDHWRTMNDVVSHIVMDHLAF